MIYNYKTKGMWSGRIRLRCFRPLAPNIASYLCSTTSIFLQPRLTTVSVGDQFFVAAGKSSMIVVYLLKQFCCCV